jgi:hypothetical protein
MMVTSPSYYKVNKTPPPNQPFFLDSSFPPKLVTNTPLDSLFEGFANHLMCMLNPPQLANLLSYSDLSLEQRKEEFVDHYDEAAGYFFKSFGNVLELNGEWYSKMWRYRAQQVPPKRLCRNPYRAGHWERIATTERAVDRRLCIWDDIRLRNWGYHGTYSSQEDSESE